VALSPDQWGDERESEESSCVARVLLTIEKHIFELDFYKCNSTFWFSLISSLRDLGDSNTISEI